jgi:hypothetical protein
VISLHPQHVEEFLDVELLDISPFWGILWRLATRLLSIVFICCVASRLDSAMLSAQQPPPPPASSGVDDERNKEILDLKRQAYEAEGKDPSKALDLYGKILKLDPNDFLARQQVREIQAQIDRNGTVVIKKRDDEARRREIARLIAQAEEALIKAKPTHAREPLDTAQKLLGQARSAMLPGDANVDNLQGRIDRLQAQIDQEMAIVVRLFWEFWGFVGLVVLGIVVALVFYFRRTGRALEMIEGPQMGEVFVLKKDATALGALASEVDWALEDPLRKISRRHCDVVRQGRHYFLVDCSLNGTFLNGRPLQKGQPALLKRGDQIGLGGEVTLRFR